MNVRASASLLQRPSRKTMQRLMTFALLAVPCATLAYFFLTLHTPVEYARTPIPITRNSLLPHRFAGPCSNCHRVIDIGPVAMNRANMDHFNLSPQHKRLLMAGQSVQDPSLMQVLRVPAITRWDILPHRYVGVCSNCHLELNIKPDSMFVRRAMRRAYQPLILARYGRERLAQGGTKNAEDRKLYRNIFGFVALITFVLSSVYVGMRSLLRKAPARFKGKLKIKPWFVAHEWLSSAFCLSTLLHWYFSDRGNNYLHVALILVIWLTLAGYALRYRLTQKQAGKNVRLVHTQRYLFVGLVALIVIGHCFAAFH